MAANNEIDHETLGLSYFESTILSQERLPILVVQFHPARIFFGISEI